MNYEDAILVRLADPSSRASIFDQLALEQLLNIAYDPELVPVEGPFEPVFTEFTLGFNPSNFGKMEGGWNTIDGANRTEAKFQLFGIGGSTMPRVDALWRGEIIARTVPAVSRITNIQTDWPSLGNIDDEIVAALGGLPADGAALEAERRNRLLAKIRATLNQPDAFTVEALDKWLSDLQVESVSDFLTRLKGTVQSGGVQVTFSPPNSLQSSPRRLPIDAALLIRDQGFSVAELLMESKFILAQLEPHGLERSPDVSFPMRKPLLIIWVVPISLFDDPDWPGGVDGSTPEAARSARRRTAGQWLAREGIGLVATA